MAHRLLQDGDKGEEHGQFANGHGVFKDAQAADIQNQTHGDKVCEGHDGRGGGPGFDPLVGDRHRVVRGGVILADFVRFGAEGSDRADAGQILLDSLAIGASIDVVASFEETKQDGSKEFYRAIVMTYTRVGGTIDAIIGSNATLEITDSIVDVAAP